MSFEGPIEEEKKEGKKEEIGEEVFLVTNEKGELHRVKTRFKKIFDSDGVLDHIEGLSGSEDLGPASEEEKKNYFGHSNEEV